MIALMLLLLVLFVWQLGLVKESILPRPLSILNALLLNRSVLLTHFSYTLFEVFIGLSLALVFALFCSAVLFFSPSLRRFIQPLMVVAHIIPVIAIAPLLLVWFGFGIIPKIVIAVLYSFFPITSTFVDGLTTTPKQYLEYAKSLKISKWQTFRHISVPYALPNLFSGLKLSAIYVVSGVVVGEYVGGYKGLGVYLRTAANSHAVSLVFATIILIISMSLFMMGLVGVFKKLILKDRVFASG
jgi:ABC-type nitrate/sulfonate/bicarbonate transport system permease component